MISFHDIFFHYKHILKNPTFSGMNNIITIDGYVYYLVIFATYFDTDITVVDHLTFNFLDDFYLI